MIHAFGPFELDDAAYELRRDGRPVIVQRRAFDLLAYLLRKHDTVVTRRDLLANVWDGATVTKDAVAHAVLAARSALGDHAHLIETVRGRGYRLVMPNGALVTRVANVEPTQLLGRFDALASFHAALAAAARGEGSALAFNGALGVGKTRLLEVFAAQRTGSRFVLAPCGASRTVTLGPIRALLAQLRRDGALFGGALRELVDLRDSAWPVDAVADELVALFASTRACEPIVLALDDLHLADDATKLLVEKIAPRLSRVPAVLITTSTAGPSTSELAPFDRAELALYVEQRLRTTLDKRTLDDLYFATRGNPFLASIASSPMQAAAIKMWLASRLPVATMRALVALSASAPSSDGDLEPAIAAGLLTEDEHGDLAFTHPLVRDALRALHANVAPFRPTSPLFALGTAPLASRAS